MSSPAGSKLVTVVIPNWNGRKLIGDTLRSLYKQTYQPIEIIVVENGSTDGSAEYLAKEFPEVIVLPQKVNLGFARGVNEGIMAASGKYIALFNNDAIAEPDWIKQLVGTIQERPGAGIVTSKMRKLVNGKKSKIFDTTGDSYYTWGIAHPRGRDEEDVGQYEGVEEVFSACGGASLYRAEVFERTGLFDPEFFAYFEDVDISFRTRLAGFQIYYQPKAVVYHMVGATSGGDTNPFTRYHTVKNLWYIYLKDMPGSLFWKYLPLFLLIQLLFLVGSFRHHVVGAQLRAIGRGLLLTPAMMVRRRKIQKLRVLSAQQVDSLLVHETPPNIKKAFRRLRIG